MLTILNKNKQKENCLKFFEACVPVVLENWFYGTPIKKLILIYPNQTH